MSPSRRVLISGAGIAGPTVAFWLARSGFQVTVVERAAGLRSSGNPVDVRGAALAVADQMGVLSRLRAAATQVRGLRFVNAAGRTVSRINLWALRGGDELELPRGELASALQAAGRDDVDYRFDDTITTLRTDAGGVDVVLDRAGERRFDYVIGADGLHSAVRQLMFGPETDFVRHLGLYIAGTALPGTVHNVHEVLMYNTPGRSVAVHPATGRGLVAFLFRGPALPDLDHRDTARHKRLLTEAFAGGGWRTDEFLDVARAADELYFDAVSQVRLAEWSRGRVVLLGDAASCVSLFGEGSSLAIIGGRTLAAALAASPDDPATAFRAFETEHRKAVEPKQRAVGQSAALLVPATRRGIAARNALARLWPVAAAVQRLS